MFLFIDKTKGVTSHDVVNTIRGVTGVKKVGHAGTLDPMATGFLIVAVGRESTKKLGNLINKTSKTYLAEILLGEEKDTHDEEGKVVRKKENFPKLPRTHLAKLIKNFEGETEQVPPKYSAIKIKGKKAYKLARAGKKFSLKKRKVNIYNIKLVSYEFPKLCFETQVSSGTYIRALARDIGRKIGSGAYLTNLRRTKIGKFSVKEAVKLNKLNSKNWKKYSKDLDI